MFWCDKVKGERKCVRVEIRQQMVNIKLQTEEGEQMKESRYKLLWMG